MLKHSCRAGIFLLLCTLPMAAQSKQIWVLRAPGEMVAYDPANFASKETVKLPPDSLKSPQNISVNSLGQILISSPASLPLAEDDAQAAGKNWFWNGKAAISLDPGVTWKSVAEGSNVVVSESAPVPYLSADGTHLFWIGNQARRMQREEMDLSTATTWLVWRTDLAGANREDLLSIKLPDCKCKKGSCEESCPYGTVWVPDEGVGRLLLMTQVVGGQTPAYNASARYREDGGKWTADFLSVPLRHVLDAASDGSAIIDAVPDSGCCGWVNQGDDQTLLRINEKSIPVFDEQQEFKNPDYDVSFYTSKAKLSPDLAYVALTITATAQANQPIQLAQEGQASPQESRRIRKALAELPAVDIKAVADVPKLLAHLPHASLIGWISEKEVLLVEDHLLIAYNVSTGARRKSSIRAEDAAHVFLR
jgi:hypothetical protein